MYEVYSRGEESEGYSVIFASGRHDGFSPDEVDLMLTVTDEMEPTMVGYEFLDTPHG